jgi:hypothetical protein
MKSNHILGVIIAVMALVIIVLTVSVAIPDEKVEPAIVEIVDTSEQEDVNISEQDDIDARIENKFKASKARIDKVLTLMDEVTVVNETIVEQATADRASIKVASDQSNTNATNHLELTTKLTELEKAHEGLKTIVRSRGYVELSTDGDLIVHDPVVGDMTMVTELFGTSSTPPPDKPKDKKADFKKVKEAEPPKYKTRWYQVWRKKDPSRVKYDQWLLNQHPQLKH